MNPRKYLLIIIVGIVIFISALSLVYLRNLNRRQFYQLQIELKQADQLQTEWGKLLLEHSAFAAPARVDQIAREQLHMGPPKSKKFIIIASHVKKNDGQQDG